NIHTMFTFETKYLEWLSASEMHQATLNWYSELNFVKDEQLFFDDLIKSYTLQLINSNHFEDSKQLVETLNKFQEDTNLLIEVVKTHRNSLQILIDGINLLGKKQLTKKSTKDLLLNCLILKSLTLRLKQIFLSI